MASNESRRCRFAPGAALALSMLMFATTVSGEPSVPMYVEHTDDPVQRYYSQALVGFAFQTKCRYQTSSQANEYERSLNSANQVFLGYVIVKGFVAQPADAVSYAREMAMGAIKFAAASDCDELSKESVRTGHRVATDFMELVDPYLQQPAEK